MAKAAHLITLGAHFVDWRDVARTRRVESESALSYAEVKAHYGELPDGQLHLRWYQHLLAINVISLVHKYDITALATLGESGYCGHSDHSATHHAVLGAQATMSQNGLNIPVYALNSEHTGKIQVPVQPGRKFAALAFHATQFQTTASGEIDPRFWQSRIRYNSLLQTETYDVFTA